MIIDKYKYPDRFGICFESDKSGRKGRMFWVEYHKQTYNAYMYLPHFLYFCVFHVSITIAW